MRYGNINFSPGELLYIKKDAREGFKPGIYLIVSENSDFVFFDRSIYLGGIPGRLNKAWINHFLQRDALNPYFENVS